MRWLAGLSRDSYVNVMDQYYPAHKAETEPRFAPINRRLHDNEFEQALERARAAGLWRLDRRWFRRSGSALRRLSRAGAGDADAADA
jgi:putative pyruvate formate lyase activating enzyme